MPVRCGITPTSAPSGSGKIEEKVNMAAPPNAIELTKQMVRMNTINPPGQETQCARLLGALLEKAGFAIKYHELSPRRASLVATIGGSAGQAPPCLSRHLDSP